MNSIPLNRPLVHEAEILASKEDYVGALKKLDEAISSLVHLTEPESLEERGILLYECFFMAGRCHLELENLSSSIENLITAKLFAKSSDDKDKLDGWIDACIDDYESLLKDEATKERARAEIVTLRGKLLKNNLTNTRIEELLTHDSLNVPMTLQIPSAFSDWFGQTVVLDRGPNNKIFVYQTRNLEEFLEVMSKNHEKHTNSTAPVPEEVAADAVISITGNLIIPDSFCAHLGTKGEIEISARHNGLEIKKKHPDECSCDDSGCAKCLAVGCRNDECSTHSMEKKGRFRQRFADKQVMTIQIPAEFAIWYGRDVLVCRGSDNGLFVVREKDMETTLEKGCQNAKDIGSPLTHEHQYELHCGILRPTEVRIGSTGALLVPESLVDWVATGGQWQFKERDSGLEVSREQS